jgi:hypothetical protein
VFTIITCSGLIKVIFIKFDKKVEVKSVNNHNIESQYKLNMIFLSTDLITRCVVIVKGVVQLFGLFAS